MPVLRFALSREDYCRFQQVLHTSPKIPPGGSPKVEVQIPVNDAMYRYFRRQQRRRRRLGEPSTMSDIMRDVLRSRVLEKLMNT